MPPGIPDPTQPFAPVAGGTGATALDPWLLAAAVLLVALTLLGIIVVWWHDRTREVA